MRQLPAASAHPGDSEWLERALCADAGEAIDDDGFSARVLKRIAAGPAQAPLRPAEWIAPQRALSLARQRRRRERLEQRWTLAGGALGFAIAVAIVLFSNVDAALDAVAAIPIAASGAGSAPLTLLLALVLGTAALAYVFLINGNRTGVR